MKILLWLFVYILTPGLVIMAKLLKSFVPSISNRINFESSSYPGFANKNEDIVAFEVSSEGELEQIMPLLNDRLKNKEKVELIFCSQSVENKVKSLQESYPEFLRTKALPLISFFPWDKESVLNWSKAHTIILCRYDFFPELLLLATQLPDSVLISATLKNKKFWINRRGTIGSVLLKNVYSCFKKILMASEVDLKRAESLELSEKLLGFYDFRTLQIGKRIQGKAQTLNGVINSLLWKSQLAPFPKSRRIIFGSCWLEDLEKVMDENWVKSIQTKNIVVVLAPHLLNEDYIKQIKEFLQLKGLEYQVLGPEIENEEVENEKGKVYISTFKGILCEFYTEFDHAFVGGGFGRSIHSVLEPFLAGCKVYCGPRTFRSTEFELIKKLAPNEVFQVADGKIVINNILATTDEELFNRVDWIKQQNCLWKEYKGELYGHAESK